MMMVRPFKRNIRVFLTCLLVSLLFLQILISTNQVKAETRSIDDLRNSVVRILCYGLDGGLYTGSGFSVGMGEPVRHIVTNYHVVEPNLEGVTVLLSKEDQINAVVVAYDKVKDIAVLELTQDLFKRPPMEIGDSKAAIASQDVYALGFPGDADLIDDTPSGDPDDVTITRGIISKISTQGGRGIFQVDVSINSGNSGGPLLNENGQVIGINTFTVTSAAGINGAVKIEELIPMLESRGIEYLSANNNKQSSGSLFAFSKIWLIVAIVCFVFLLIVGLLLFFFIRKRKAHSVHVSHSSPYNQKPVLKGVSGYFAGQTIELVDHDLNIGRDAKQCQLVFPLSMEEISRKHCTLHFDKHAQTFTIEDHSTNGTYLQSGARIPAGKITQLRPGDRFYLSSKDILFEVSWERR
ncbi:hypothetical protein J2Z40_000422 [Cytobacillus eiseniae]|uniref:FHA domain-containing protein n=1 Tax=Cytobacillus eiseniae TaxID=762947 RepID=A0ABS4RAZ9_9BACI|nr:trypsin-like peptidase domain-containing protein [Cytobacillus eiseniae]MBP2239869.1 hypothetical protein [Cytobacillus eiseniae]